jgi:hypothetical protein
MTDAGLTDAGQTHQSNMTVARLISTSTSPLILLVSPRTQPAHHLEHMQPPPLFSKSTHLLKHCARQALDQLQCCHTHNDIHKAASSLADGKRAVNL